MLCHGSLVECNTLTGYPLLLGKIRASLRTHYSLLAEQRGIGVAVAKHQQEYEDLRPEYQTKQSKKRVEESQLDSCLLSLSLLLRSQVGGSCLT